ncbi:MAG: ATP-binding protein, partial [Myxococcales bacterium]
GVQRVAQIVGAMKRFAHPETRTKTPADINAALLDTVTVARNEIKYVADVETTLQTLPMIKCHLSDLNQVFLNLLVNAAHAISDKHGRDNKGKVSINTRCIDDMVEIAISDDGCGIPEPIRHRLFEPFFTTKEVGRGTGQGLSLARSIIVERHGGTLTFESEAGVGTTFLIRLPIHAQDSTGRTAETLPAA